MRGARRRADADDRRGALRRARHRHRQVHVREHRRARARDGGRADRGRASTSHGDLPAPLRGHARTPSSSCWRAALANVERFDDGLLTVTHLTRDDYAAPGAEESYSEGVIDHLRSVEGTAVAGARARAAPTASRRGRRKVSLRATDGRVDVSRHRARRRRRRPPPGRRASRPSWPYDELVALPARAGRRSSSSQPPWRTAVVLLSTSRPGRPRTTSSRGVRRRLGRGARSATPGTLDPFATGLLLVLVGRATRVQRFLMALPKSYETRRAAGRGRRPPATRRARSRDRAHARRAARAARPGASRQRPPAYSRGQGRRPSAPTSWRARGEEVELPEREVDRLPLRAAAGARATARGFAHRVLVGDLRALARSPTSATPTAWSCGARAIGPVRRRRTPIRERVLPLGEALAFLPRVDARRRRRRGAPATARRVRRRRGRGRARPARRRRRADRRRRAPRRTALLKPVVGFRGVKVTPAPRRAAAPAPGRRRHVRRRPPRPPRGHRAAPTPSLTFEPHPLGGRRARRGAPQLLTTLERKAELIGELGVEELVVIPFDGDFAARSAAGASSTTCSSGALGADARQRGGELPLRPQGARATPTLLRADEPLRDARRRRCSRSTARSSPRATSAGSCSAARSSTPTSCLGAPFTVARRGRPRRQARARRSASRRPTSSRADGYVVPGHGVYACRARTADGAVHVGGDQRRRAPDVRHRPRRAHRGLPASTSTATSTARRCGSSSCKRLRGEQRFDSVDALVEQMGRDVEDARAIAA